MSSTIPSSSEIYCCTTADRDDRWTLSSPLFAVVRCPTVNCEVSFVESSLQGTTGAVDKRNREARKRERNRTTVSLPPLPGIRLFHARVLFLTLDTPRIASSTSARSMQLTDLIRVEHPITDADPTDVDIFASALGTLFPDETRNQHGDPGATVIYTPSAASCLHGKEIKLSVPEPEKDEERRLFAHYLWNAGVWLAEGVAENDAEVASGDGGGGGGRVSDEKSDVRGRWHGWGVKGQKVLELGAGAHELYFIVVCKYIITNQSQGLGLTGIVSCLTGAEEVRNCQTIACSLNEVLT